jgi:hypothetical protein
MLGNTEVQLMNNPQRPLKERIFLAAAVAVDKVFQHFNLEAELTPDEKKKYEAMKKGKITK